MRFFIFLSLLSLFCTINAYSQPSEKTQNISTITVVNQYNTTLTFSLAINPEVFPDFPATFELSPGESKTSKIHADQDIEGYIRVTSPDSKDNAYFGVDYSGIKGYM